MLTEEESVMPLVINSKRNSSSSSDNFTGTSHQGSVRSGRSDKGSVVRSGRSDQEGHIREVTSGIGQTREVRTGRSDRGV